MPAPFFFAGRQATKALFSRTGDAAMMYSYVIRQGRILRQDKGAALSDAIWIDLIAPGKDEMALLRELGVDVPTLVLPHEDMFPKWLLSPHLEYCRAPIGQAP